MMLSQNVKVTTALDYASGTATRNGATLDMAGYEGVMMIAKFATIATSAVTTIKAQQDTDSAGGTMADLAGTSQSVAADDDNQIFIIDLYRPRERYVRLVVGKDGTNAVAEDAIYIQYGAKTAPVINTVTDKVTLEEHLSPAEGSA